MLPNAARLSEEAIISLNSQRFASTSSRPCVKLESAESPEWEHQPCSGGGIQADHRMHEDPRVQAAPSRPLEYQPPWQPFQQPWNKEACPQPWTKEACPAGM